MACQNNLKQLGLAAHSAHDSQGALPPVFGFYTPGGVASGGQGPVHYHLLPYLEQDNLHKQAAGNPPRATWFATDNGVLFVPVKTFLCPSDPSIAAGGLD